MEGRSEGLPPLAITCWTCRACRRVRIKDSCFCLQVLFRGGGSACNVKGALSRGSFPFLGLPGEHVERASRPKNRERCEQNNQSTAQEPSRRGPTWRQGDPERREVWDENTECRAPLLPCISRCLAPQDFSLKKLN